jgi:methylmalonyl-CoA/ethylmalonyl-CoA epimerase
MIPVAQGLEFHHIGVACSDIEKEALLLEPLGYRVERGPFVDERQGVRGMFMGTQTPRLELLESLGEGTAGVLAPWLKEGTKLYHVAYTTRNLVIGIERMRAFGSKLVVAPVSAVAFGGREIAFVMMPNRLMIELIQSE